MREMKDSGFSWIGKIPCDWSMQRVKHAFYRKNEKAMQDNPVILSLARSGVRERDISNNEGQIAESYYNYNPVDVDDLLINPMDLYSGANCSISKIRGVISPAYINLRYKEGINPNFFDYYFKLQYWQMAFFSYGKGVSFENRWTLTSDTLMNYPIVVPSYSEQCNITAYLDNKCTKIDSIIEKQEKVIEKLKAYKLSVITEAVTKGLNPDVKMKDSGVEWIGEIPENWEIGKLKHTISFIESGVSVNAGQNEATTNELGVLKTSSVSKFVFDVHENKSVNRDEERRVSCPVRSNTLIVSRMNTPELVGACGYVEQDYDNIFLPDRLWQVHFVSNLNVKFIWYYLRSKCVRYYISSLSTGTSSSMQNISQGQFGNIMLVLPPAVNQKDIVYYLDKKCSAIDKSIEKKQAIIEKLKEYKKSLIYEVVTGKKEV